MRNRLQMGWCALLVLLTAGCDTTQLAKQMVGALDTPESMMEGMIGCEESFIDLLASVNGEQSAQDAQPKADELAQRFDDYADRFVVLVQDKPPDGKRLHELFDERMKDAKARYTQEARRLLEDPVLKAQLPTLSTKFKNAQGEFQRRMSLLAFGHKLDADGNRIETGPPPAPPASGPPPPPPLMASTAPDRGRRFQAPLPVDPTGAGSIASAPVPVADPPAASPPTAGETPQQPPSGTGEREVPEWVQEARKRAEEARERMRNGQPPFPPGGPPMPGRPNAFGGPPGRPAAPMPTDTVTIVLLRRPRDGGDKLADIISKLDTFKSRSIKTSSNSFRMTVGPVADVREFAKKLTWATVTSLDEDGRTITIEIDTAKYP